MTRNVYRYRFVEWIRFDDVLATIELAVMAVESLHGQDRTRLDAGFTSDQGRRTLAIDATTEVGQSLNQIFVGYLRHEFGEDAFGVTRLVVGRNAGNCATSLRDRLLHGSQEALETEFQN